MHIIDVLIIYSLENAWTHSSIKAPLAALQQVNNKSAKAITNSSLINTVKFKFQWNFSYTVLKIGLIPQEVPTSFIFSLLEELTYLQDFFLSLKPLLSLPCLLFFFFLLAMFLGFWLQSVSFIFSQLILFLHTHWYNLSTVHCGLLNNRHSPICQTDT